MRELVRDQGDEALVAGDDRRRDETEARMLHAADGKSGRQYQQVVAVPAVGPEGLLGGLEHRLGILEFRNRGVEDLLFRVHARTLAHGFEFEVAHGERDEVGRNRLRHAERELAVQFRAGIVVGAHHRPQRRRRAHRRVVRDAHARRILERDETACVDRLRLGVKERMALARGLLRFEPLQRQCIRRRLVADGHARGIGWHLHGQWRAKVVRGLAHREGGVDKNVVMPGAHGFDRKAACVEDQRVVLLVQALQVQLRFAHEDLALEVDREVQVDVGRTVVVRVRKRVIVEARCRPRLRARFGRGFRAGREQHDCGAERDTVPMGAFQHCFLDGQIRGVTVPSCSTERHRRTSGRF